MCRCRLVNHVGNRESTKCTTYHRGKTLCKTTCENSCQRQIEKCQMIRIRTRAFEAGSDPRGHVWVTWGVYLCAGKPPLADIILSHQPELT